MTFNVSDLTLNKELIDLGLPKGMIIDNNRKCRKHYQNV